MKLRSHFIWRGNTIETGPLEGPRDAYEPNIKDGNSDTNSRCDDIENEIREVTTNTKNMKKILMSLLKVGVIHLGCFSFPACHREPFDVVNVRLMKLERIIWRWQKVVRPKIQDNKKHPDNGRGHMI
ncbi:hypothetical protein PIB30_056722 [Stylosanthes scabra]|uniref:Uncharacterized protein n=1 Tax=Stylosanthes scabra TaxID=79078 RepID=A0ABU6WKM0_9FABA|nr:hypothetical protein [Stylosanthes scabra]